MALSVLPFYQHSSKKELVFQTGRALSALYGIQVALILVHFILIVLPLLLYEYQGLQFGKTNVYDFFFFYPLNFQQFQAILGGYK